jgi:hypothetical protein
MKILIKMPLDESSQYKAMELSILLKDYNCFSVPNFIDYLLITKIRTDYNSAVLQGLLAADLFAEENKNCIIIGNASKKNNFDLVIGINLNGADLTPQNDIQINSMKQDEKFKNSGFSQLLNNLYEPKDCENFLGGETEKIAEFIKTR